MLNCFSGYLSLCLLVIYYDYYVLICFSASPRDKIITVPVGSPAIARLALAGRTALEDRSLVSIPALSEDELQGTALGAETLTDARKYVPLI